MSRRRLLAVAPVAHPGGAESVLMRTLAGLRARGWETTLTTPGPGPLRQAAIEDGHRTETLHLGGLNRGGGARAVTAWPRARRMAREADVVYLNGTVCGRLLPALRGNRTVLHVHDIVDRVPRIWRAADVVLAASGAVARALRPLRSEVVYGPADPNPPEASPPWEPSERPVVGFVGRIEPRKGVLDLIAAAPLISERSPGARVVIVGDDPYESDPRYFEAVHSAQGVEHYGWVDNAPGLLRHLDVLVLPSHQEPFGTVLAEAMAVGTPVVATRVGGLAEVVDDGVTGVLVPPRDPVALAEGVARVLSQREQMGIAAREHARRFDPDAYVEKVESLL